MKKAEAKDALTPSQLITNQITELTNRIRQSSLT